jgi:hypothetical protein
MMPRALARHARETRRKLSIEQEDLIVWEVAERHPKRSDTDDFVAEGKVLPAAAMPLP